MRLSRWDPFRELEDVSARLNRFLGPTGPGRRTDDDTTDVLADWAPTVDVQETKAAYLVHADLPAVKKDDIKVSVSDGVLSIEGERRQEREDNGKKFHRIERSYGRFVRRLALPTDVDQAKVVAEFKDGVLVVSLPKSESTAPRSIDVAVM